MANYGYYVVPSKQMDIISDTCFILTRDIQVKILENPSGSTRRRTSQINQKQYVQGTLVTKQKLYNADMTIPSNKVLCRCSETGYYFECFTTDLKSISQEVHDLLIAMSSCYERFEMYSNRQRLAEGLKIKPGTLVHVDSTAYNGNGVVRYRGTITGKAGVYFGVEVDTPTRDGTCNGSFKGVSYFKCDNGKAMFVSLSHVTPRRDVPSTSMRKAMPPSRRNQSHVSEEGPLRHTFGISEYELQNLSVSIDSRVMIFTEVKGRESQEKGTVQFIGRLPRDRSLEIYVGIYLDNATGNGTGLYEGKHLFTTKQNHAALVPLSGVLPLEFSETTPRRAVKVKSEKKMYRNSDRSPVPRRYSSSSDDSAEAMDLYGPDDKANIATTSRHDPPEVGSRNDPAHSFPAVGRSNHHNSMATSTSTVKNHSFPIAARTRNKERKWDDLALQDAALRDDITDYPGFDSGSMVEIHNLEGSGGKAMYGVIQWIGRLPSKEYLMAGVELEESVNSGCDGYYLGKYYFHCPLGKGIFVYLSDCKMDQRFKMPEPNELLKRMTSKDFGDYDSPKIGGQVAPPNKLLDTMLGPSKGIQGHHNSCYLDSTLFSLFAYSHVLDTVLFRPKQFDDIPEYEQAQIVLKEDIINPLRKKNFVRADKIMALRELLDRLGNVSGLVGEEKDPEEFLSTMLNQVFKAEPLIEIRHVDTDQRSTNICYQIFVDKENHAALPTTQKLLEHSLVSAGLKFTESPVCLILQMPRFGKNYKMFSKVRPSLELDITNLVEMIPRSCGICDGLAEFECKDCFLEKQSAATMHTFCRDCNDKFHKHGTRKGHQSKKFKISPEFMNYYHENKENRENIMFEKEKLDLFAVVCIATSHYVSFARCGNRSNAKWSFFDSMADRVGEQMGYNVPAVTHCPEFENWLTMPDHEIMAMDPKFMPEHMRRVLCDAYMCLYENPELMFYK